MNVYKIPHTNLKVSRIAYGCMGIGGRWNSEPMTAFNPPADASEPVRRTAELVARLAQEKDTSLEAIVLAWLLRHPAGIQPIVGTTKPERVAASCLADNVELSREEWYQLFSAARGAPLS